jgi:hypothetical protein
VRGPEFNFRYCSSLKNERTIIENHRCSEIEAVELRGDKKENNHFINNQ